jgi:hypothetical protein
MQPLSGRSFIWIHPSEGGREEVSEGQRMRRGRERERASERERETVSEGYRRGVKKRAHEQFTDFQSSIFLCEVFNLDVEMSCESNYVLGRRPNVAPYLTALSTFRTLKRNTPTFLPPLAAASPR